MNRKNAMFSLVLLILLLLTACSNLSSYRDGTYSAQLADFSESGWKDTVDITIQGGKIVSINWDAIYKNDAIPIRKKQYSKSGLYGMLTVNAVGEWYDQATAAEQFVLEKGIEALAVNEEGYTDAVTGCTIHVSDFEALLLQCLEQAKK